MHVLAELEFHRREKVVDVIIKWLENQWYPEDTLAYWTNILGLDIYEVREQKEEERERKKKEQQQQRLAKRDDPRRESKTPTSSSVLPPPPPPPPLSSLSSQTTHMSQPRHDPRRANLGQDPRTQEKRALEHEEEPAASSPLKRARRSRWTSLIFSICVCLYGYDYGYDYVAL